MVYPRDTFRSQCAVNQMPNFAQLGQHPGPRHAGYIIQEIRVFASFPEEKPHNLVNLESILDHIQKQLNNMARGSRLNGSQDFLVPLS